MILSCRPFGNINYGFALPRNSSYTHEFSVAMLELQQEGFLGRMTEKWFKSGSVCSAETQASQEAAAEGGDQLQFSDMAGVFITLAVGVAAGMTVLCVELIYASYRDTKCKDIEVGSCFNPVCSFYAFKVSFWLSFETGKYYFIFLHSSLKCFKYSNLPKCN